jgi:hypothetical protein
MSTRESISCFCRHRTPGLDDSDLPDLQCACQQAMRHICYTENDKRLCFLKYPDDDKDLSHKHKFKTWRGKIDSAGPGLHGEA